MQAGDGVFSTVKVVEGRPFALDRHLARLARGARAVGLPEPSEAAVRREVGAVLGREHLALGRMRVTWTAPGLVTVAAVPTPPAAPSAAVVTVPWPRNERGPVVGHKATSYADDVVALAHARAQGADEGLLADQAGRLSEGTTTSVFYVLDGELCTPSLATGCLPGITRALVLEWYGATELDAPLAEIRARAGEVFLTSSLRDVQPVHRWDERELPAPGPVTREVERAWRARAAGLLGL